MDKKKKRKQPRRMTKMTFSKIWVNRLLWVALFDIQLPFLLAFLGREQIAETLAITIVGEIIGIMIPYFTKSFFETKEEENNKLIRDSRLYNNNLEFLNNEDEEESMR